MSQMSDKYCLGTLCSLTREILSHLQRKAFLVYNEGLGDNRSLSVYSIIQCDKLVSDTV